MSRKEYVGEMIERVIRKNKKLAESQREQGNVERKSESWGSQKQHKRPGQ